jgi:hypothetical protein
MPRFVLLYHDCPQRYERTSHWDFMLEEGGALRTWALAALPRAWRAAWEATVPLFAGCAAVAEGDAVAAERLGDHRLAYLELEGPVSGGRGEVRRIDGGIYEGDSIILLHGELLNGSIQIGKESPNSWMLRVVDGA